MVTVRVSIARQGISVRNRPSLMCSIKALCTAVLIANATPQSGLLQDFNVRCV